MSKTISFFKEAVKNYKTSGTLVPSSRFLANKMLSNINFSESQVIIELGPGNGAITKNILEKLNPEALLICFEINNVFYEELKEIEHPQLIILKESAENIIIEIEKLGFKKVDAIVSSLPLTIIPKHISSKILNNSHSSLKKNGIFIQYQYSLSYLMKLKKVFGKNITLDFETLNFPPAFIYKCVKK
ncbi:Phospholipid N-methyltransferase [Tenacibaculum sp. MAR_2009_124]|uniref:class I SAM-dependent methyltransferase n=1 Tax=Tenacibaculum sp. MAR_2009_124 TaxID=1250059 RepID=UPI0008958B78|nr:rRNA adenine N-6-methyltransferase family protein [Tenacibaculum sp. MAR_2009_124]SEC34215.1 Phospholipid N-methyltransferase [Tenacibaculum sp. MAR_2009_124]